MAITKIKSNQLTINSPQGYLINGKIVPSVSSNNLTVALKTLSGDDPSSGNPIQVRIGDTIHTITSALSVTKNAGTNWFNAGSSELATYEIDYFVYLGYNATDGVVIGFSRIPYAGEYDDFSTTTTNEKYCAISTITNAASGDDYENIGRFAATLSAGAGYTWTVPTFSNKNLIQRPIYKTRVLAWQPVYSAAGDMTYTSVTTDNAQYQINENMCNIRAYFYGTTGGVASNIFYGSTPFDAYLDAKSTALVRDGGSSASNTTGFVEVGDLIGVKKIDHSNWGLGTLRLVQAYWVNYCIGSL